MALSRCEYKLTSDGVVRPVAVGRPLRSPWFCFRLTVTDELDYAFQKIIKNNS